MGAQPNEPVSASAEPHDAILRFLIVFAVAWLVVVALPWWVSHTQWRAADVLVAVPVALAGLSLYAEGGRRQALRQWALPTIFIFANAFAVQSEVGFEAAWLLMAGASLCAYWLWVLRASAVAPTRGVEGERQRATSLRPPRPSSTRTRRYVLPTTIALTIVSVVSVALYRSGREERPFVLAMGLMFVVVAFIGGLSPMLRADKKRSTLRHAGGRSVLMWGYVASALLLLWMYNHYR